MARIVIEVKDKTKEAVQRMAAQAKPRKTLKELVLNVLGIKDE